MAGSCAFCCLTIKHLIMFAFLMSSDNSFHALIADGKQCVKGKVGTCPYELNIVTISEIVWIFLEL